MREGEEGEGNPEVEEKMVVECGAVSAGVGGKKPGCKQERGVRVGGPRLAGEEHESRISCLRAGDAEHVSRVFLSETHRCRFREP